MMKQRVNIALGLLATGALLLVVSLLADMIWLMVGCETNKCFAASLIFLCSAVATNVLNCLSVAIVFPSFCVIVKYLYTTLNNTILRSSPQVLKLLNK